jgi:hypothetical protein
MSRLQRLAPVLVALLCACSEPAPHNLVGTWLGFITELDPGYQQLELEFTASGNFRSELRIYGVYFGQTNQDLSGFRRVEGTVRIEGDSLSFTPLRLVTWDLAFGPDAPEVVEEPYTGSPVYEGARFSIEDDRLNLEYTDYYNVFPLQVTLQFTRAP